LPTAQHTTAEQILKSICVDIVILATLYANKKKTDENVWQFALALQELSNRLENRGDGTMGNVWRDQFILGFSDAGLRRELWGKVGAALDSSFVEEILRADEFGEVRQAFFLK